MLRAVCEGRLDYTVVPGDCAELLPLLVDKGVDHVITDPPYSSDVHRGMRAGKRAEMPSARDARARTRQATDLGFAHITPELRALVAQHAARVARRWSLVFSDVESVHLWRRDLEAAGLTYRRTGAWMRLGGAPQLSGDRPAAGFEAIAIAHPKGRSKWNGGGKAGVWSHAVVINRVGRGGRKEGVIPLRVNEAQKPLGLMLDLVAQFTEPGDLVLDPFCGSGTTGVACAQLGRRFIGFELRPEQVEHALRRIGSEGGK